MRSIIGLIVIVSNCNNVKTYIKNSTSMLSVLFVTSGGAFDFFVLFMPSKLNKYDKLNLLCISNAEFTCDWHGDLTIKVFMVWLTLST